MSKLLISTILGFILCTNIAHSAQPVISNYILQTQSEKTIQEVAQKFEVSRAHRNAFEVIVPQHRAAEFLRMAPQAKLLNADISATVRQIFYNSKMSPLRAQGYRSFNEIVALLNSTSLKYPAISKLVQYGTSQQGKPLLALRVSNHLNDGAKVPRVMLTAATHGDEIITTEVLLNLMGEIITSSETNPRYKKFLDNLEIVFIPVLNPDGFAEQNRYDNGSDPNRSYPFPENVTGDPTASINGIINFVKTYPITGSIDFHAFGRLIMYPWGYTKNYLPPEIRNVFHTITSKMAATNRYKNGDISHVIYVAKGSSADFYYWKLNALSLGIEVGDSKAPNPAKIEQYTMEQAESTWIFLDSFIK